MARRQRDRSLVRPIGAQCRITMNLLPCALRRAQEPFPCTLHWRLFFFSHEEAAMFSQSFRPVCLLTSLPVGKGVIRLLGLGCVAWTQRPAVARVATPTHPP